jgi:hypothetical protein
VLVVAGHTVLPAMRDRIAAAARVVAERKYAALPHPSRPLAAYQADADRMADALVAAFRASNLGLYAPVLWALAGIALVRRRAALVAVVAADLATFAAGFHPALAKEHFYPPTPLTEWLAARPGLHRVTAVGETLVPDAHLMYGLADVRGMDFRTVWYDRYLSLVPERLPWISYGVLFGPVSSPLLEVLNVAYVIGGESGEVAMREGTVAVRALRDVQPRSFMVYEATVAPDDDAALARLAAEPHAVYRRVVLATPGAAMARPEAAPSRQVTLQSYAARAARWRVETSAAGYLVTTDAYYPGWRAYLDGRPAEMLRANVAFRAVAVPAGAHEVSFRYEPGSVRLGLALSALSALAIAGLLLTRRSPAPAAASGAGGSPPS